MPSLGRHHLVVSVMPAREAYQLRECRRRQAEVYVPLVHQLARVATVGLHAVPGPPGDQRRRDHPVFDTRSTAGYRHCVHPLHASAAGRKAAARQP